MARGRINGISTPCLALDAGDSLVISSPNWSVIIYCIERLRYGKMRNGRCFRHRNRRRFGLALAITHCPQLLCIQFPHCEDSQLLDASLGLDPLADILRILVEHPSIGIISWYARYLVPA